MGKTLLLLEDVAKGVINCRYCRGETFHHIMATLLEEKSWETLLSDITGGDIVLQNGIIAWEDVTGRYCRGFTFHHEMATV